LNEPSSFRIVFLGTPEFAVAPLRALVEAGWHVAGVVTAPDKPGGRGLQVQTSPVKQYAAAHNLPILQPANLKDPGFQSELAAWKADLQVVVAFRMLPEAVWNMPPLGSINLHASLLPAYRGAAPIHHAVMNGETETGLTTFFLQHAIDTGDLLDQVRLPIGPDETSGELHDRMMVEGAQLVLRSVARIAQGHRSGQPQPDGAQEPAAPKIFRQDAEVNWNRTAAELHNFVRGLSPSPAAWTLWKGKNLKLFRSRLCGQNEPVWEAVSKGSLLPDPASGLSGLGEPCTEEAFHRAAPGACYLHASALYMKTAQDWLQILELQPEGRKRMDAAAFIRGLNG
jgi:methionyl-tRNA formyltransferase